MGAYVKNGVYVFSARLLLFSSSHAITGNTFTIANLIPTDL